MRCGRAYLLLREIICTKGLMQGIHRLLHMRVRLLHLQLQLLHVCFYGELLLFCLRLCSQSPLHIGLGAWRRRLGKCTGLHMHSADTVGAT